MWLPIGVACVNSFVVKRSAESSKVELKESEVILWQLEAMIGWNAIHIKTEVKKKWKEEEEEKEEEEKEEEEEIIKKER